MIEIKEVARNTYLLHCGEVPVYSMPQVAYLIVDDVSVLIEPGCTAAASSLFDQSSRLGVDLDRVSYIIPTHIHIDHGGGAGFLARRLPGAKVVLHPKGARNMVDPARLIQATRMVFGENCEDHFGPILPVPEAQIHEASDGEVIHLGNRDLSIHFSPGHASHHIAIYDRLTNGLFCGEALGFPADVGSGVLLPAGVPPFDPELYVESIDKLAKLSPDVLFFSHIEPRDNACDLIRKVRETTVAFTDIIGRAVEAGEDDGTILGRLSEHVNSISPGTEMPSFEMTLSGYIDFFRNRK